LLTLKHIINNRKQICSGIPKGYRPLNAFMGRKPKIQCRIERDTNEAIEEYIENQPEEISQSEAVRHLLRAGLAEKGYPVAAADGRGPTTRTERAKETVYGWLERSVYAMVVLLAGMLVTGGSAIAFGTAPMPFAWLGLATFTASLAAILSAGIWFAIELSTDSPTAESEVTA
jgi:hypothetical protein